MSVAHIITSVVNIATSAQSGSQVITVPADAEIAIAFIGGYHVNDGWLGLTPLSINSTNVTQILREDVDNSNMHGWLGYLSLPTTGNQTLAWALGFSFQTGGYIVVSFFKGVDTGAPIKSSGISNSDVLGMTPFAVGDMMVGATSSYQTPVIVTDSGQTEILNTVVFRDTTVAMAHKNNAGDFYNTGGVTIQAIACVIAQAAGGGGPVFISISDSGRGGDVPGLAVLSSIAERGASVDGCSISVNIPLADTATAQESLSSAVSSLLTEIIHGEESAVLQVDIPVQEILVAADTGQVAAVLSSREEGHSDDGIQIGTFLPAQDGGGGAEAVQTLAITPVHDGGLAIEDLTLSISLSLTEQSSGRESVALAIAFALTDDGTAVESISMTDTAQVNIADALFTREALASAIRISMAETALGSELLSLSIDITIADDGAGGEQIVATLPVGILDSAAGVESLSWTLAALLGALSENLGIEFKSVARGIESRTVVREVKP